MIDNKIRKRLDALVHECTSLDSSFIAEGKSTHFIEIRMDATGPIRINANTEGLIHLAKVFLELAASATEGAHRHLDETGLVDLCDRELIIANKRASWEPS